MSQPKYDIIQHAFEGATGESALATLVAHLRTLEAYLVLGYELDPTSPPVPAFSVTLRRQPPTIPAPRSKRVTAATTAEDIREMLSLAFDPELLLVTVDSLLEPTRASGKLRPKALQVVHKAGISLAADVVVFDHDYAFDRAIGWRGYDGPGDRVSANLKKLGLAWGTPVPKDLQAWIYIQTGGKWLPRKRR